MSSGNRNPARAAALANIPIWAFVNNKDKEEVRSFAEQSVATVNNCNGFAYLTAVDDHRRNAWEHDSWTEALQNPATLAWLLAQRRGWVQWTPPPCRPWKWWHILTIPCLFLVTVRLAWWWRQQTDSGNHNR